MQRAATHCKFDNAKADFLSHATSRCIVLQRTAAHCNIDNAKTNALSHTLLQYTTTHCNLLHYHTVTHCKIDNQFLYHIATLCNTPKHTKTHHTIDNAKTDFLKHTATHCNTLLLQHTATHCNTLQHNPPHCRIDNTKTDLLQNGTEYKRISHIFPSKRECADILLVCASACACACARACAWVWRLMRERGVVPNNAWT